MMATLIARSRNRGWVCEGASLPGCMARGATIEKALINIQKVVTAFLESCVRGARAGDGFFSPLERPSLALEGFALAGATQCDAVIRLRLPVPPSTKQFLKILNLHGVGVGQILLFGRILG